MFTRTSITKRWQLGRRRRANRGSPRQAAGWRRTICKYDGGFPDALALRTALPAAANSTPPTGVAGLAGAASLSQGPMIVVAMMRCRIAGKEAGCVAGSCSDVPWIRSAGNNL